MGEDALHFNFFTFHLLLHFTLSSLHYFTPFNMTVKHHLFLFLGILALCLLLACKTTSRTQYTLKESPSSPVSDFTALKKILKGKRVVALGEFTHGGKEINQLKAELIKYLHEELDYELLLFEAGIGEGIAIEFDRQQLTKGQLLTAGLPGPWHTESYLELMTYLKAKPELTIAGFDVQRTGRSFDRLLKKMLLIAGADTAQYNPLEAQFGQMMRQFTNRKTKADDAMLAQKEKLKRQYLNLTQLFTAEKSRLEKHWDKQQLALVLKTFSNRIAYLDYFIRFKLNNNYRERWAARDSLMADNASWLIRERYPDKKVIISAHNFHIDKANEQELTMGELLAAEFGDAYYAIGVFGGKGSYANNGRKEEIMSITKAKNDIQQIVLGFDQEITLLPPPNKTTPAIAWWLEPVLVNHSFINLTNDRYMRLDQAFDAIIGIRNISPPTYIN